MKMPKAYYSNYLISVHFDNGFMPDTLAGQKEMCENFLSDIGNLAREHGKRLFSTYSICSGENGSHAHFGVNWLPTSRNGYKKSKAKRPHIEKHTVSNLLHANYFYVDNESQAIKRITHDKKFVTEYIILQPKKGQDVLFSGFYQHSIIEPVHSIENQQSYSSPVFSWVSSETRTNGCMRNILKLRLSIFQFILVISFILITRF